MSRIGVAVVGAGYWGPNLIRNFASLPEASLVYVCDLDPARLDAIKRAHPEVEVTTSLAEVLADSAVHGVVVATPAETHREVAEACLQAGKDILVEKPLATCATDARHIVTTALALGQVLMAGHLFMYSAAIRKMVELVGAGKVGKVRYLTGIRTSMGGTARLDTNIVWDALIHDAYVLPALQGRPPLRVRVTGKGYLTEMEDVVFAIFDFGQDVLAHCYASWYALEKARRLTIVGSEGILHMDEFAQPKLTYFNRRYVRSGVPDAKGRLRWQWVDEGAEPQTLQEQEPLRLECQEFLHCVRRRAKPSTDGAAALVAVEIIEACQASLKADGSWITVEHVRA